MNHQDTFTKCTEISCFYTFKFAITKSLTSAKNTPLEQSERTHALTMPFSLVDSSKWSWPNLWSNFNVLVRNFPDICAISVRFLNRRHKNNNITVNKKRRFRQEILPGSLVLSKQHIDCNAMHDCRLTQIAHNVHKMRQNGAGREKVVIYTCLPSYSSLLQKPYSDAFVKEEYCYCRRSDCYYSSVDWHHCHQLRQLQDLSQNRESP